MTPRREVPDAVVGGESVYQMLEMTERDKIQQLCEYRLTTIHGVASFSRKTGNDTAIKPIAISNRRNR
jgi:hypothetical protein